MKKVSNIEDLDGLKTSRFTIRIVRDFVCVEGDEENYCRLYKGMNFSEIVFILNYLGFEIEYQEPPKSIEFTETDVLFAKSHVLAGCGEWWVAKDASGHIFIYHCRPARSFACWCGGGESSRVFGIFFENMSYDHEPIQIKTIAESEVPK